MKHRIITIVVLAIVALILSGVWYYRADAPVAPQIILTGPNGEAVNVFVEVVDTHEERSAGLMNRTSLEPGHGMFFIFDQEQPLSFWMKNTIIPLDILYFDESGLFVSRATMQPCEEEPCPLYASEAPAQYALEVSAGTNSTAPVGPGWNVSLENY